MSPREFYRRRKIAVRRGLLEDRLFKRFRTFVRWRVERGDFLKGG